VAKLVVLYTRPEDPEGFDAHYRETHAPLAQAVPGATWTFTRMTGTPRGGEPAYYLIAEATFAGDEDLQAGMRSEQMRETGRDAAQMTQRYGSEATMLIGTDYP
jgi:uncharacterized protein (TIGR02118 family)